MLQPVLHVRPLACACPPLPVLHFVYVPGLRSVEGMDMLERVRLDPRASKQFLLLAHLYANTGAVQLVSGRGMGCAWRSRSAGLISASWRLLGVGQRHPPSTPPDAGEREPWQAGPRHRQHHRPPSLLLPCVRVPLQTPAAWPSCAARC